MNFSLEVIECEARVFEESSGIQVPQIRIKHVSEKGRLSVNDLECIDLVGYNSMAPFVDGMSLSSPVVTELPTTARMTETLATYHDVPEVIWYSSGYAANTGFLGALGNRLKSVSILPFVRSRLRETIKVPSVFFVHKKAVHFSLSEGVSKSDSGNTIYFFQGGDQLQDALRKSQDQDGDAVRIIVTDSVCSVTGRLYALNNFAGLAEEYGALLVVDESHAVGLLGPGGRGISAGLADNYRRFLFQTASLSKGVGAVGGYVTLPVPGLRTFLAFASPEHVFSSQPLMRHAEEATNNIKRLMSNEADQERRRVAEVASFLRRTLKERGYDILGSESHIVPIFIGEKQKAKSIQKALLENGWATGVFHFPAVPVGRAMLRLSVGARHTKRHVQDFVEALYQAHRIC